MVFGDGAWVGGWVDESLFCVLNVIVSVVLFCIVMFVLCDPLEKEMVHLLGLSKLTKKMAPLCVAGRLPLLLLLCIVLFLLLLIHKVQSLLVHDRLSLLKICDSVDELLIQDSAAEDEEGEVE